jgi:3-dehydroquinate synthetase
MTQENENKRQADELEPEAVAAVEATLEPEVPKKRQWVTLRGTSMDLRAGTGIVSDIGHDLKSSVGRPHVCALARTAEAPAELVEALRRDLTDEGFLVKTINLPSGEKAADVSAAGALYASLAAAEVTSDDLVCAVGDEKALSLAGYVCPDWCGGVMLAVVPLDLRSALLASVTPRALDAAGVPEMVSRDAQTRFEICDLDVVGTADADSEDVLFSRAVMVSTAMADSDKAFGKLWDATDEIVAGNRVALCEQIVETVRSRGKIVASSSLAIRQSIGYGQTFSAALRSLVPAEVPDSAIFAEAMRFAARLSAGLGNFEIDDVFTQDDLLERLGLGEVRARVEPEALLAAIKAERFRRSNRFMLALPRSLGRVRLTLVEEDVLAEHVAAWCGAHDVEA